MDYSRQEYEHLFKNNYPHMYRMAFSMVENADDAKDNVHQVSSLMWRGKPQVARESVRGYVSDAKAVKHFLRYDTLLLGRESEALNTLCLSLYFCFDNRP